MTERSVHLHESTRRSLCRLAFVLLGLVPMTVCLVMAVNTLTPGYSRRQATVWERLLSQQYGVIVRVEQANSPAPLQYRLDNVQLFHPETQLRMGGIERVILRRAQDQWLVQASEAQLNMSHFAECSRAIHDWYICRPLNDRQRAAVELDRLTITHEDQTAELIDIVAELLPETDKWGMKASFSIAQEAKKSKSLSQESLPQNPTTNSTQGRPDPIANQLIVVRQHAPEKSSTELQLRANSNLPLWLIARSIQPKSSDSQLALIEPLLTGCSFTGVIDVRYQTSGTSIYLTEARLEELDFGHLRWAPMAVFSGVGSLRLNQAKLDATGLQFAEGSFDLGPGRMDAEFFQSLAHYLKWETPRQNPTQVIAFDRMAARFRVQPAAFQLVGSVADGTILSDAHGSLARRHDPSAMPVSSLVHALADSPGSATLVRQALVWLPLDDTQRRETAQVLRMRRY